MPWKTDSTTGKHEATKPNTETAMRAKKLVLRLLTPVVLSVLIISSIAVVTANHGADLRSISYDQTRYGTIDTHDPFGNRGYYEPVTFSGNAGDEVTISMYSATGDSYLKLLSPSGSVIAENDDYSDYDSQVSLTLPESGQYTIIATSYGDRDTFDYSLAISANTPNNLQHKITLQAQGQPRANYEFTVGGQVALGDRANPVDDPSNPTHPDSAGSSTASGSVAANGIDTYWYSGEIIDFANSGGGVNVYIDGNQVDPSELGSGGDEGSDNVGDDNSGSSGTPDLSVRGRDATTTPGGNAEVQFTLTNDGSSTVSNVGVQVRFEEFPGSWSSSDISDGDGDWNDNGGWSVSTLDSGQLKSGSFTMDIPADASPGQYQIPIQAVDGNGNVVDQAIATIEVEQESTPTPTPTDTPTPTPTDTPIETPTSTNTSNDTQTPANGSAGNQTNSQTIAPTPTLTPTDTPTATAIPTTTEPPDSGGIGGFELFTGGFVAIVFLLIAFAAGVQMAGRKEK